MKKSENINKLESFIKKNAYNVSIKDYLGSESKWVMDFKALSIQSDFLKVFSEIFFDYLDDLGLTKVQIGGLETGAIPLISGISIYDNKGRVKNTFYIRKGRKKHSIPRQIEGNIDNETPIILIDDLINSGKSIEKQLEVIKTESQAEVIGVYCAIQYRDNSYYVAKFGEKIKILAPFELNNFKESLGISNLITQEKPNYGSKYKQVYGKKLSQANYYYVVPKSSPVIYGDSLFFGVDDGHFYRIQKDTGEIIWSRKVSFGSKGKYILSTPVIWKNFVIFGAYDGVVYCFNSENGALHWSFIDADWVGSSPCINSKDGVVYIGLEFGLFNKRGGIVGIDIKTGNSIWKNYQTMKEYTHASPMYDPESHTVFCGCNDTYFRAYSAKKGELLWEFKTDGEIKYGAIVGPTKKEVIFGSMDGSIYVLRIDNGELLYKFDAFYGFYSNPVVYNDSVIACSLDKRVYSFSLSTGKKNWEYLTGGRIFSTPTLYNESIFVGANDGKVCEIAAGTGELIAYIQLGERITTKVSVEESQGLKRIYVLNHGCELHKFEEDSNWK